MGIKLSKNVVQKTNYIKYPDIEGFEIEIKYLTKKELASIGKRCSTKKIDTEQMGKMTEEINQELYQRTIAEEVILDWRGLTVKKARQLIPLSDELDDNEIVEPDLDNKTALIQFSLHFDTWLQTVMTNLVHFTAKQEKVELEDLG